MSPDEPFRPRLWPAILIAAVAVGMATIPAAVATRTQAHFFSMFGAMVLGPLLLAAWWVFFARVRGPARWQVPVLALAGAVAVIVTVYRSPREMPTVLVYGLPFVAVVALGWLILSLPLAGGVRRVGTYAAVLAAWGLFALARIDQADSEVMPEFRWAWVPSAEERFLAERAARGTAAPATVAAVAVGPGDWAEFRGPNRDSKLSGASIGTDWAKNPPTEVWRHRVGPGWGTFAVAGGKLFTQEQRGESEAVVCYDAATGNEVWEHAESARFYDGQAGAGPRATPTVKDGRVYAQGATGVLMCLDAATGKPVWTKKLTDVGGVVPQWGYAGSPLVRDGLVFAYTGGPDGRGLSAFKAADGDLAWQAGNATHSYASAQFARLAGTDQVLLVSDYGLEAFRPADGKKLWEYVQKNPGGNRVAQPAVIDDTGVLLGTGAGSDLGTRRLAVAGNPTDGFRVDVAWATNKPRPYFNDGVTHDGNYYGFDDKSLVCVNLVTGRPMWSAGTKFGHGQVLLLADQSLLLVQADDGKVYLVAAKPDEFDELAKLPALAKKTWNHPVVAHGHLYVRNGQEAACYKLPPAK